MMRFPESLCVTFWRETSARSLVIQRVAGLFLDRAWPESGLPAFTVVFIAKYWFGHPEPEIVISQSLARCRSMRFYSVVRIGLAYLLSLVFAIGYGYVAAYNKRIGGVDDCGAGHSASRFQY